MMLIQFLVAVMSAASAADPDDIKELTEKTDQMRNNTDPMMDDIKRQTDNTDQLDDDIVGELDDDTHESIESVVSVQLDAGLVKGVAEEWSTVIGCREQKRSVTTFYNIPYAKPPTGPRRFQSPEPMDKFPGFWDGTKDRGEFVQCIQLRPEWGGKHKVVGDEDCLYLTVHTPSMPTSEDDSPELRPVIVYIHGGTFMYGSQHNIHPRSLVTDYKIVFVKINYRLGPFGFLSTGCREVPGNMGLRDQILALEWVRDNIEKFGGDPFLVTIAGSYAGGASVHFHMLSRHSKELFVAAISISGTMLSPWAIAENLPRKTQLLAEHVGCVSAVKIRTRVSTKDMVECLRSRSAAFLADAVRFALPVLYNPASPWAPTVDADFADDPLIPYYPGVWMSQRSGSDADWLVGVSNAEGLYLGAELLSNQNLVAKMEQEWPKYSQYILDYDNILTTRTKRLNANRIKKEYFQSESKTATTENNVTGICNDLSSLKGFCEMIGDRLFVIDAERSARWMSESFTAFVYFFVYDAVREDSSMDGNEFLAEVQRLDFYRDPIQFRPKLTNPTLPEQSIIKYMNKVFAGFAEFGEPHLENSDASHRLEWPPVMPDEFSYVKIMNGTHQKIVTHVAELGRRHFWQSLAFKEYKRYPNPKQLVNFGDKSVQHYEMKQPLREFLPEAAGSLKARFVRPASVF